LWMMAIVTEQWNNSAITDLLEHFVVESIVPLKAGLVSQ